MTETSAALMWADTIKDCVSEAEPVHPGGDTSCGSMLIEGACTAFRSHTLAMAGTAGFGFEQSGFLYLVHVHAERVPPKG
jgi:hypothetical protein